MVKKITSIDELLENEESQMTGEGWKKELTIKYILLRNGVIYCQEYDFYADMMPCRQKNCGANHTWLKCLNGKLFWACAVHQTCYGPITLDEGLKRKEYVVDVDKAVEVAKESGQTIPPEIKDIFLASKTIMPRRKRPNE